MKSLLSLAGVGRILSAVGGLLVFVMMIHICADVILKFAIRSPIPGTMEIASAFYMVGIAFLPLLLVTVTKSHVSVEFFTLRLSERNKAIVDLFAYVFSFAALAFLFNAGLDQAMHKMASGESWETANGSIAIWPSRWIMPVGIGFCVLGFAYLIWITFKSIRGHNDQG